MEGDGVQSHLMEAKVRGGDRKVEWGVHHHKHWSDWFLCEKKTSSEMRVAQCRPALELRV